MPTILDASAILSGKELVLEGEVLIPASVVDEIRPGPRRRQLEYWLSTILKTAHAKQEHIQTVQEVTKETGDDARLSQQDIDVLAIALETKGTILTDDYSIQNMAKKLGIEYVPISEGGIKTEIEWTYRCKGCGRYYEKMMDDCPICGSELRSARR